MMSNNDEATAVRFPDFLREGRKAAGKTQQEVADHLGVVQSAVSAWEIGRASMPMSVFFKLVQFLELDLANAMACFVDAPAAAADSSSDAGVPIAGDDAPDPGVGRGEGSTGTAGAIAALAST